jgi:predicted AAA+ superfamily ATPase
MSVGPVRQVPDILKLRELHAAMDRAVLDAYGWSDIPTDCEFLLDYETDEEDWNDKKKPYRYRWPDEVLARLLELNAARGKDRTALGPLLETFVFQELRRQASWHEEDIRFYHFRDKDNFEVDIVLERGAYEIAGAEVKASATVTGADFRGLCKLRDTARNRFVGGIVLYDGETCVNFGDAMHAVPIRLLWETT